MPPEEFDGRTGEVPAVSTWSQARAPVRELLTQLLLERYQQWKPHVVRSSGEIHCDAIARVLAKHKDRPWYRSYSKTVSDALSPHGQGPTWGTLRLMMEAFGMTQDHVDELSKLMRKADQAMKELARTGSR